MQDIEEWANDYREVFGEVEVMKRTAVLRTEEDRKAVLSQVATLSLAKPWEVSVRLYDAHRTLDQNAISHAWYEQVSKETGEYTALQVKCYCKLHFGVPILRAEDPEFREMYDRAIKPHLTYEQKLQAMKFLPVTSLMKTKQKSRYLEQVQAHYAERGIRLEFPEAA